MMFGYVAGPSDPLVEDVTVVLFAMGAWSLVTLLQLRSVRKLLAGLARHASNSGTRGLSP